MCYSPVSNGGETNNARQTNGHTNQSITRRQHTGRGCTSGAGLLTSTAASPSACARPCRGQGSASSETLTGGGRGRGHLQRKPQAQSPARQSAGASAASAAVFASAHGGAGHCFRERRACRFEGAKDGDRPGNRRGERYAPRRGERLRRLSRDRSRSLLSWRSRSPPREPPPPPPPRSTDTSTRLPCGAEMRSTEDHKSQQAWRRASEAARGRLVCVGGEGRPACRPSQGFHKDTRERRKAKRKRPSLLNPNLPTPGLPESHAPLHRRNVIARSKPDVCVSQSRRVSELACESAYQPVRSRRPRIHRRRRTPLATRGLRSVPCRKVIRLPPILWSSESLATRKRAQKRRLLQLPAPPEMH